MIALKLLFQSLAGVGAIFGVAGSGYYAYNFPKDNFYLVSAPATVNSDQPPKELLTTKDKLVSTTDSLVETKEAPTTEKNYKCETGGKNKKQKDEDCYLYSLTIVPATDKSLNLKKIQEFIADDTKNIDVVKKTEAKADLKDHKFFLLKASSSLYSSWKLDGSETINLLSKTAETTSPTTYKSYGALTVHAKITSSIIEGKTSFAIVKFEKTNIDEPFDITASGATIKCKFKYSDNSTLKPCVISEFTKPTSNQTQKTLEFTDITLPTTQATITSITNEKYYLLQYTPETKHSIIDLNKKVIVVIQTTTGNESTTKEREFKVQTPVFIQSPTAGKIKEAAIFQ